MQTVTLAQLQGFMEAVLPPLIEDQREKAIDAGRTFVMGLGNLEPSSRPDNYESAFASICALWTAPETQIQGLWAASRLVQYVVEATREQPQRSPRPIVPLQPRNPHNLGNEELQKIIHCLFDKGRGNAGHPRCIVDTPHKIDFAIRVEETTGEILQVADNISGLSQVRQGQHHLNLYYSEGNNGLIGFMAPTQIPQALKTLLEKKFSNIKTQRTINDLIRNLGNTLQPSFPQEADYFNGNVLNLIKLVREEFTRRTKIDSIVSAPHVEIYFSTSGLIVGISVCIPNTNIEYLCGCPKWGQVKASISYSVWQDPSKQKRVCLPERWRLVNISPLKRVRNAHYTTIESIRQNLQTGKNRFWTRLINF